MGDYVVADSLNKAYGQNHAVKDLNFTVKEGEVFGFLGPNGAGKTTTLRMICAMLDPTGGKCTVDGKDTVEDRIAVKQMTGYLPEEDYLYGDMSVRDHLAYIAELYGVESVKEQTHLSLREVDMQSHIDDTIKTLSKGQRRRIAIAKTLIHNPQLMLLDEVTSGLDPVYARKMAEVVKNLHREGRTIILSTHLLDEATRLCDRILIINHGQAMALGKIDAILDETSTENLEDAFFKLIGQVKD